MRFPFCILFTMVVLIGCRSNTDPLVVDIPEQAVWIDFALSMRGDGDISRHSIFAKSGNHTRMESINPEDKVVFFRGNLRQIRIGPEVTSKSIEEFIPFDGTEDTIARSQIIKRETIRGIPVQAFFYRDEDIRVGHYVSEIDRRLLRMVSVYPDGDSDWSDYFWVDAVALNPTWFDPDAESDLLRVAFRNEIEAAKLEFENWLETHYGSASEAEQIDDGNAEKPPGDERTQ